MTRSVRLHASAVVVAGRGLLIIGASGSGKSSLALQLMALGATLVADDQTDVTQRQDGLLLSAPAPIRGLIEARGVGLLRAHSSDGVLHAVVDLDTVEQDRLPHPHYAEILGTSVICLHKVVSDAWPAALVQYLSGGRSAPE